MTKTVYAICHPEDFVKIGVSENPKKRLESLQTACPYELWLGAEIQTDEPEALESWLHDRFSENNVRGEWFDFDPDQWELIAELIELQPSDITEVESVVGANGLEVVKP